jgi:polyisoprenoid-binding protein YceI
MKSPLLFLAVLLAGALALTLPGAPDPARASAAAAAKTFSVDPVHSSVMFQIRFQGISSFFGRFEKISGSFAIDDADLASSKFDVTIDTESVSTGNSQRDGHLRSPDFFNAKKHPKITFKSSKVTKKGDKELEVAGDLTLRGETRSVTAKVAYGGIIKDAFAGDDRAGLDGTLVIHRKDFGMDFAMDRLGDEVTIHIGLTGVDKE